ncbi:MAG: response regulator transcription factor [Pseudomonadota bacterium]
MIRLLIADDHTLMREGLKQLFAMIGDIQLAGEAVNGAQALKRLEQGGVDLLLLDMSMPGLSGHELILRIRQSHPRLPILVLSMHNEARIADQALRAGANGYYTKDGDPDTLIQAIRTIAGGGRFLDPNLSQILAMDFTREEERPRHERLSPREWQIFMQLAQGRGVNDIADELAISNKTVSTHKSRLMDKMAFANNAELVRYALVHGLVG